MTAEFPNPYLPTYTFGAFSGDPAIVIGAISGTLVNGEITYLDANSAVFDYNLLGTSVTITSAGDFQNDGTGGIDSGTITEIKIQNIEGTTTFLTLSNLSITVAELSTVLLAYQAGDTAPFQQNVLSVSWNFQGTDGADSFIPLSPNEEASGDNVAILMGGDDAFAGGAGDDTMFGGAGNDTLFGGAGFDVFSGDGGNDTIFGGADGDYVIFESALADYTTGVDGSFVTVTGGGETDYLDGIEGATFSGLAYYLNGATFVANDNTRVDVDGTRPWSKIYEHRFFDGTLQLQIVDYDNGRSVEQRFDEGLLTFKEINDKGNTQNWQTIQESYSNGASTPDSRFVAYDDGTTSQRSFENGFVTRHVQEDTLDARPWSQIITNYHPDINGAAQGGVSDRTVVDDQGVSVIERFSFDGKLQQRERLDSDTASVRPWVQILESYDEFTGDLVSKTVDYDDGRLQTFSYGEDGMGQNILLSESIKDVDNIFDWDLKAKNYDTDTGVLFSSTVTYDTLLRVSTFYNLNTGAVNGKQWDDEESMVQDNWLRINEAYYDNGSLQARVVTEDDLTARSKLYYENGNLQSDAIFDDGKLYTWESQITSYDENGVKTSFIITYDDGTSDVTDFLTL